MNLALVKKDSGRYEEADQQLQEVLALQIKKFGRKHPDVALTLYNLADVQMRLTKYGEAAGYFRQALEIQKSVLGPGHPDTLDSWYNLACMMSLEGDRAGALKELQGAVDAGYADVHAMETDEQLNGLRGDARFSGLLAEVKERAAKGQGKKQG